MRVVTVRKASMADTSMRMWWPDLTRFGARLSVAWNPSVGRNFLKLAILDRERFARESGLGPQADLLRVMRDVGFTYLASEVRSGAERAHDAAVGEQLSRREIERLTNEAKRHLYFYSPAMGDVAAPFIRRFVPALHADDVKEFGLREIKHFDHEYVTADTVRSFISRLQRFDGAESGVYWSIPRDRMAALAAQRSALPVNLVLEYTDVPKAEMPQEELASILSAYSAFHPVRAVESAVRMATLGMDGYPIKAPRLSACAIVYPTYEAAVEANDGDIEGVERERFEWGIPIAYAHPGKQLLVLRDARYLEINPLHVPEPEVEVPGAQAHLTFLRHMHAVRERYEGLNAAGLLDPASWNNETLVSQVDKDFDFIAGAMRLAVKPFGKKAGLVDAASLMALSGIKPSAFDTTFDRGFLHFLSQFRNTLQETLAQKKHELAAAQPIQPAVRAVIDAVRQRSAPLAEGRREDAGEKIGGARKDLAKVGLREEELASMNERELSKLVIKDNVWPKLDLLAMRERGVAPEVAYLIRDLRNAFPVNPQRGGFNTKQDMLRSRAAQPLTPQRCASFVRAATVIQIELADVRTVEDLAGAYYRIITQTGLVNDPYHVWDRSHWFCDGAGYRAIGRELMKAIGRPMPNGVMNINYPELQRTLHRARAATGLGWDWAFKAEAAAAPDAPADAPAKVPKPVPEFEHLAHIARRGPDFRDGQPVTEEMFLTRFGFRGLEYGNWLPQHERQIVLDHAYDGFADLAQALRLPDKAMGLGGTMAIAFGARGSGGHRAGAAHFEPMRTVMNLTRMSGAGSVAHEWFHALDYWMAQHYDLSRTQPVSEMPLGKLISGRAGVAFLLQSTISFLNVRDATPEEVAQRMCHQVEHGQRLTLTEALTAEFNRRMAALERTLPVERRDDGFRGRAKAILAQHLCAVPELAEYGIQSIANADSFQGAIVDAYREYGGDVEDLTARHILNVVASLAISNKQRTDNAVADVANFRPGKHKHDTSMLTDAKYYDGFRSKPYWSTPVEMAARGFESYVQDIVERQEGRLSQYLVYGAQDRPHASHSIYPRGPERAVAAEAYDRLFAAIAKDLTPALTEGRRQQPSQSNPQISEP